MTRQAGNVKRTVIVDAYNTIHQVPRLRRRLEKSLNEARETLIRQCGALLAARRDVGAFKLVFDGDSSVPGPRVHMVSGVQTVYTKSGESADERIVAMVRDAMIPSACLVVTADREVAAGAEAHGAVVMPPQAFFEEAASDPTPAGRGGADGSDKPELTGALAKSINDQLRKEWGIEK
jgi:predicted RNA-binding protein with PIN domain